VGSRGGVDRFSQVSWVTDIMIAGRWPCGHGRVAGESEREWRMGMTGGDESSTRERERGRGWAGLLGRTRCWAARASAGMSARAGRTVGPSRRENGGSGPIGDFVFLFQKYELYLFISLEILWSSNNSENFCVSFSRYKLIRKNIKC
jgi:hypothetical protein